MSFYSRVIFPRLCDLLLGTELVAARRRELLAQARGQVLEIGFGTGLNVEHYSPRVAKLTTIDPNEGMHRLAVRRIKSSPIEVEQRVLRSEQLPFEDGSFDCVVSTFTLCSIDDVSRALTEVYRALKPGGQFLFLEHGLSPEPKVQKWQRRLNWLQGKLADGCRLDRDVKQLIAGQPFAATALREFYLEETPKTHGYLYQGAATKGA